MANSPQARKRARQDVKRRSRNMSERSAMRTLIKKVISAIESQDIEAARTAYREATSSLDRAARKNLIRRNKAARYKRRLNNHIRELASSS